MRNLSCFALGGIFCTYAFLHPCIILVKKEHFVLESEYLVTLVVVVPLAQINDWNQKYEKLTDMVVPRLDILVMGVCC